MTSSLRNFFCKNAIQLRLRLNLIHSLQKSSSICFSKYKHNSASLTGKCILESPLNAEDSKAYILSSKDVVVVGKHNRVNRTSRRELEEENGGDLGVESSGLLEENEKGMLDNLIDHASKQDLERVAIELLAGRSLTAVELRKKLQGKKFPICSIVSVITDLCARGLLNDGLYAETFTRSRWSSSCWGPRRIKQALISKGVNEMHADRAIKLVFKDGDIGEEQEPGSGMSKPSMDHLLVQASKQWLRSREVPKETRKSRIIRWLQYRGFNWSIINFVLKKLDSGHPP
ncbi:unnamed protein product [Cuscuta campestris]|uniref:Regulatory protein RecX n=1 Tax=Cuscuta campestris TaxID=132261 RepID=A0A484M4A8_9ASTE|nr:unnamed protein product [Cuscuta campestris]